MSFYEVARRMRGVASRRAVELGEVVGVEPLVVRIGNGEYKAGPGGWCFYEPVVAVKDVVYKGIACTGASVNCAHGSISSFNATDGKIEGCEARMKYKVGDLLAVQQMAGDASFMILAKVQEVV